MNNGLGYKLANVPTITGLSTVTADAIISDTLIVNGVDISTVLTGITYSNAGGIDLTTIDNNLTITSGKKIKCATVPTDNDDVTNKLYVDGKVSLTGNETISGDKTFNGTMIINSGHNWRIYAPSTGITASITLSFPFYQVYPINTTTPITITLPTITSAMVGAHFSFKKVLNSPTITFNIVSGGGFMPFNGLSVVASVIMTSAQYQTEFLCNGGIYYQVNTDIQNYVTTDTAQTISATKTFTAVPLCATAPTTANMLCNKTYVDSIGGGTSTTATTTQPFYIVGSTSSTNSTDTTLYKNSRVYVNPATGGIFCDEQNIFNTTGQAFSYNFSSVSQFEFRNNSFSLPNTSVFYNYNTAGTQRAVLTLTGDAGASTFDGLSAASTTVAVADDNSATTMYPVFTTATAGQKSLLFDSITTFLKYKPSSGILSAVLYSVGGILEPVAGDNAGFLSQNTGSSATVIQNQATSGVIHLATTNSINNLTLPLIISSTDLTTNTTNCPTITGFTAPATNDNTSKIATTSWVQSTLAASTTIGAATVNVADNNTATTMYPIFTTTGAGQKSLLFDSTTSPLSYTPSTGTLKALIYNLPTTLDSQLTASGTTITLSNNNIGGTYNFVVSTSGVPLTILSLNETNSFYRVPFIVSAIGAPSSTSSFSVTDSASLKGVNMLTDASTAGVFNSLVAANDSVIYGKGNLVNTGNLTLTTWSNTTTGVRLTPTTALIGAGGTGATPTAYVSCSGTTVSIGGNPTFQNRNIIVDNAGSAITIGNGASTATANIIMTKLSTASATVFTTGNNTIIGQATGNALVAASANNTLVGANAGLLATGNGNTCIGVNAGSNLTTGIQNICIGVNAAVPTITNSNQIVIGTGNETQFIQGQFNWRVGAAITATGALPTPYAQFYTITSAAATTVTLQNPSAAYIGTHIMFKRRSNTQVITFTTVGGGLVMMGFGGVVLGANVTMTAAQFQSELICDGTSWYQFNMT